MSLGIFEFHNVIFIYQRSLFQVKGFKGQCNKNNDVYFLEKAASNVQRERIKWYGMHVYVTTNSD